MPHAQGLTVSAENVDGEAIAVGHCSLYSSLYGFASFVGSFEILLSTFNPGALYTSTGDSWDHKRHEELDKTSYCICLPENEAPYKWGKTRPTGETAGFQVEVEAEVESLSCCCLPSVLFCSSVAKRVVG